jgi:hypothetical protein
MLSPRPHVYAPPLVVYTIRLIGDMVCISSVTVSSDEALIVARDYDGKVCLWDATGKSRQLLSHAESPFGHSEPTSLSFLLSKLHPDHRLSYGRFCSPLGHHGQDLEGDWYPHFACHWPHPSSIKRQYCILRYEERLAARQ